MVSTVVGLTGAFGSGCSAAALYLQARRRFQVVALSDELKRQWQEAHGDKPWKRFDLQLLGDQLRQQHDPGVLVDMAMPDVVMRPAFQGLLEEGAEADDDIPSLLVVDGIRNLGEVDRLRTLFGYRFTLIALVSSQECRWNRVGVSDYEAKGLTRADFLADDARDRNEEVDWGQQVELCVDQSDIVISNSSDVTLESFQEKLLEHVDLVTGTITRPPNQDEIWMNMAYSSRHGSRCLKRRVGAVVVDEFGQVVGTGYNENPVGTNPCRDEPEYNFGCYRDIVRNEHFATLEQRGTSCPICGERFYSITGPPWSCPSCLADGVKTDLEPLFFPDRAMNWCTAVHAEVWALMASGGRARGSTLYTTTFPCTQCAEYITQAGVTEIVFTEPYPDIRSADRFELAEIVYRQFEGVRSSSFERVFRQSESG